MGGNKRNGRERKPSSLFSIFSVFRSRRSYEKDDFDDAINIRRVRSSDEDRGRWVGERDIDRKASDFIAKFYATRVSDSEWQTVKV
uniref:Uncharacterized protein n=1 Tax=Nelumbo nucifera TaxID=4432 RepID=A0A822YUG8_NELNU|nr:TPA_asm: hypothetical protein HUJ06_011739 [Nelumbo nucifera]